MKETKISIIIPVYNSEITIQKTLESIFSQNYNNYEVIIVNDGSTDNTEVVLKKLANDNGKIIYISQKNQGPGAARELGLSKATGDLIGFLDADDYFSEGLFEFINFSFNLHDIDVLQFDYNLIMNQKSKGSPYKSNKEILLEGSLNILTEFHRKKLINNFLWNKVFKKEILKGISFPKLFAAEDQVFLNTIFMQTGNMLISNRVFSNYVQSEGSLTRSDFNPRHLDNIDAGIEMYNSLNETFPTLVSYPALFICSYIARNYSKISSLSGEHSVEFSERFLHLFDKYYTLSLNGTAWQAASFKRKAVIRLFKINPKLVSFFV